MDSQTRSTSNCRLKINVTDLEVYTKALQVTTSCIGRKYLSKKWDYINRVLDNWTSTL